MDLMQIHRHPVMTEHIPQVRTASANTYLHLGLQLPSTDTELMLAFPLYHTSYVR